MRTCLHANVILYKKQGNALKRRYYYKGIIFWRQKKQWKHFIVIRSLLINLYHQACCVVGKYTGLKKARDPQPGD